MTGSTRQRVNELLVELRSSGLRRRPAEGRRPVRLRTRRRGGARAGGGRDRDRSRARSLLDRRRARRGGDSGHPSRHLRPRHDRELPRSRRQRGRVRPAGRDRRHARSSSWGSAASSASSTGSSPRGLPPETPAAAISRGTLPDQEVVRTTLAHLASARRRARRPGAARDRRRRRARAGLTPPG